MYESILKDNQIHLYGTTSLPVELQAVEGLGYALSFAMPIPKSVIKTIEEQPSKLYFHHYRTTNAYLDHVAMKVIQAMINEGYNACYVPASQSQSEDGLSALLSHKAVALIAGLGGIGKNNLLLTRQFGPAVRLSTVLTDMPLPDATISDNPCLGCDECVRACPSGALIGREYRTGLAREEMIDAKKCSIHMKKHYQSIGRGSVCGLCIKACPLTLG